MQHNQFDYNHDKGLVDKVLYLAIGLSLFLVILKAWGWYISQSLSLEASLLDSSADFLSSAVNFLAVRYSRKPANEDYQFGHGKAEALAGFTQSIFILISTFWIIKTAIFRESAHCEIPVNASLVVFVILGIASVVTLILVSIQYRAFKKTNSLAIKADYMHYQADTLSNVAGIIALIAFKYFDITWVDNLFGVLIAVYLAYNCSEVFAKSFSILMDKELGPEIKRKLKKIILDNKQVIDVHELKTRTSGSQNFFQAHIDVDPNLDLINAHRIAEDVENDIHRHFPNSQVIIHVDPYGYEHINQKNH